METKIRFHTNVMRLSHQWGRNGGLTVTYHRPKPQTNRKVGEKRMNHPKLKKLNLLKTNSPEERDLVKHVVASMLAKLGEERTVKVLTDLNQADIKLVDFVNALGGTLRNVPDPPRMKWNKDATPDYFHLDGGPYPKENPLEAVQHFLQRKYGEEQGREKLRKMDGLSVLKLADKLKQEVSENTTKIAKKVGEQEFYSPPKMQW